MPAQRALLPRSTPTTYVLARMVERVTGRGLPELPDDHLFKPMGVDHAEWDRWSRLPLAGPI